VTTVLEDVKEALKRSVEIAKRSVELRSRRASDEEVERFGADLESLILAAGDALKRLDAELLTEFVRDHELLARARSEGYAAGYAECQADVVVHGRRWPQPACRDLVETIRIGDHVGAAKRAKGGGHAGR
jgi:hypothetical protein